MKTLDFHIQVHRSQPIDSRKASFIMGFSHLALVTLSPPQAARLLLSFLPLAAAVSALRAQAPIPPPFSRNLVILDPAHGGQDHGASFNGLLEKDLVLSLTASLRASLASRGFTVTTTRDAELPPNEPVLSTDQRADTANHLRPVACILIHATPSGSGVHIATSGLVSPYTAAESTGPLPWDTAQTVYVAQSLRLANSLGLALLHAKLPVLLTRTALRPLDNLTCPAVAVEVSPLAASGGRSTAVSDAGYQHRIAEALATALLAWRNNVAPAAGATP